MENKEIENFVDALYSFDIEELENETKFLENYKKLQQENKRLKEKINKLELLIENLKFGVVLNQEQEDLLDKILLDGDNNE